MKKLASWIIFDLLASAILIAAPQAVLNNPKIAVVSFKQCVEESKLGRKEQASFEQLKKQMESVLEEKEKTLNDLAAKLNDADYLDSLTPEAETDLKRKFRAMNQEISQQQAQYYQALSQANVKIVQKLQEVVNKAAQQLAKQENLDLVFNDEACFFASPSLNISDKVIKIMDEMKVEEEPLPNVKDIKGK